MNPRKATWKYCLLQPIGLGILTVGLWTCLAPAVQAFPINPGDILISNHTGSNVQRLQPNGTVTTLTNVSGTPIGLAFDPDGNLYINVNQGIVRLDKNTNALTTFFTGSGQREGLTFSPGNQHFYSASFGGSHVDEVDLAGHLVRSFAIPGVSAPVGISARGNTLLVSDNGSGGIYRGTLSGTTFSLVGNVSFGSGYAVDIDTLGNIYANDFGRNVTVKFAAGGGRSDFITGLSNPANGLSIGDDGSFTIDEYSANAISVWNSDGTLRHRFFGITSPDELVVFAPERSGGDVTPEPSSLIIFGVSLGLFSIGYCRRRFPQWLACR